MRNAVSGGGKEIKGSRVMVELDTSEIEHSPIGASSSHRWLNCPGSYKLAAMAPPQAASSYAREGTVAHAVAEKLLRGEVEPWELVGTEGVGEEMIAGASKYVDHVRGLIDVGDELFIEYGFRLTALHERAFGTADAIVLKLDAIHVIDFKYGAGVPVEVADNSQLIYYALGALELLSAAARGTVKAVHLWLVQPRAPHTDGPVRHWVTDVPTLLGWLDKFRKAVAACFEDDAPLCRGDWCRWCPALITCPEQRALTLAQTKLDFADTKRIDLPAGPGLTPVQVATVLQQKPVIEAWLKGIEAFAKSELELGRDIPGFKVVSGRGSRTWSDADAAQRFLVSEIGENAFAPREILSVAQAAKRVKLPEHLVKYAEGAAVLAPSTDKRPARRTSAADDFTPVADFSPTDF